MLSLCVYICIYIYIEKNSGFLILLQKWWSATRGFSHETNKEIKNSRNPITLGDGYSSLQMAEPLLGIPLNWSLIVGWSVGLRRVFIQQALQSHVGWVPPSPWKISEGRVGYMELWTAILSNSNNPFLTQNN